MNVTQNTSLQSIRRLILFFIVALVFSGVTAFPLQWELGLARDMMHALQWQNVFSTWIETVYNGVLETNSKYPFIAYGTDWLAFAHLMIAVAFLGPLKDPVKNIWVVEFGIIACLSVFPLAFIAGWVRGIPLYWQIIDCSFGFFGGIILWICRIKIRRLSGNAAIESRGAC